MSVYAVYDRPDATAHVVVADRFSWFAALLPPVYFGAHRLWFELMVYGFVVLFMILEGRWIGSGASVWLYLLMAVWIGLEAPMLRRRGLARRGWTHRADLVAASLDLAELDYRRAGRAA